MTRTGTLALAAVVAGALSLGATGAFAADCPAGQTKADAMKPGATKPEGVTDNVLGTIDLSKFNPPLNGYQFRMRKLVVQPGGVVPWHSHEARPANILVVEGSITEYRSTCAVPIEHKAGDVAVEFGADLAHWWKNTSDKPAVLISADILPPMMKDDGMM